MSFAIAMTLVVLISAGLLLYQFYSGALAERPESDAAEPSPLARPQAPSPSPGLSAHRAA